MPLLLTAGLARTPAATASLLLNLELVATIVLAALFFGEHIGRRVAGGTVLVVVAGARDLGAARGQLVFATAPFVGVLIARSPSATRCSAPRSLR